MVASIRVLRPGESRKRHIRRPNFPILGSMRPFGLYPIMLHPVLPGETLKSGKTKWSVVSQPLKHPLAGAWLETWLFYVKLTDLDRDLGGMFISDTYSDSGWTSQNIRARLFQTNAENGTYHWVRKCIERVRDAYFINEGEAAVEMGADDNDVPMMKLNQRSWYQNMMFEPAEVALDTSGPRDAAEQLTAWQMVQQMQMTELTYESYLEQYGVQSMKLGIGEPEILRFSRSWTKPVNTIDPTDGTPSSAWVWNDEMSIEKDKKFSEPGFILMAAGIRPKMFQKAIEYPLVQQLWGFSDWYPAYNLADPAAGIKQVGTDDAVFIAGTNAAEGEVQLLYDHRDLLSHGEQFINDRANTPYGIPFSDGMSTIAAADPSAVRGEYPLVADIKLLFTGTSTEKTRAYYEGIVGLTIAGHVEDTTV